jgi:hypothetical protein
MRFERPDVAVLGLHDRGGGAPKETAYARQNGAGDTTSSDCHAMHLNQPLQSTLDRYQWLEDEMKTKLALSSGS